MLLAYVGIHITIFSRACQRFFRPFRSFRKKIFPRHRKSISSSSLVNMGSEKNSAGVTPSVLSRMSSVRRCSIFRIPTVAKVNVGDTPEQVLAVLGEPYGYARTQEGSAFSARTWKYYSANYRKLLERSENADIEDFGDLGSAIDLEEQLENTAYDYIEVNFTGSDDALTVLSVFFEPGRVGSGGAEKAVEACEVLSAEIVRYAEYATVVYAVTYADGSYYKAQVRAPLAEEVTNWHASTSAEVHWFDRYSNEFREQARIIAEETP